MQAVNIARTTQQQSRAGDNQQNSFEDKSGSLPQQSEVIVSSSNPQTNSVTTVATFDSSRPDNTKSNAQLSFIEKVINDPNISSISLINVTRNQLEYFLQALPTDQSLLMKIKSVTIQRYFGGILEDVIDDFLSKFQSLETLDLEMIRSHFLNLSMLGGSLTHLKLTRSENIKSQLDLSSLTSLTHLSLYDCQNLQAVILPSNAKLITLNLEFCRNLKLQSKSLSGFNSLEHLNLSHCYQITDKIIQDLENLVKLENLSLNYCLRLSNACVKSLLKLKKLNSLLLSGCGWLDEAAYLEIKGKFKFAEINIPFRSPPHPRRHHNVLRCKVCRI